MSTLGVGRLNTAARETLAAPQVTSDKWTIDANPWKVSLPSALRRWIAGLPQEESIPN